MKTTIPKAKSDTTRLIMLERLGEWANRWRRFYPSESQWVVETRSFNQLNDALSEYPTSLVFIEVTTENTQRFLSFADEVSRIYPRCATAVASKTFGQSNYVSSALVGWSLRELGVLFVAESTRDIESIAAWWERQVARFPPSESSIREQIFRRLPLAS